MAPIPRVVLGSMACLALASAAAAQPALTDRLFVNVNAAFQEGSARLAVETPIEAFGRTGSLSVDDGLGTAVLLDAGVSVRVARLVAVGVGYSTVGSTGYHPYTASAPSPILGNFPITAHDVTPKMEHREQVVYLSASFVRAVTDRFDCAVSAGPAFFRVQQDVPYTTGLSGGPVATVAVPTGRRADESTVGFHAGLDLNYMFSRHLGGGLLLRYSRGSIDLPYSTSSMTVGGLQIGAGVRARF